MAKLPQPDGCIHCPIDEEELKHPFNWRTSTYYGLVPKEGWQYVKMFQDASPEDMREPARYFSGLNEYGMRWDTLDNMGVVGHVMFGERGVDFLSDDTCLGTDGFIEPTTDPKTDTPY